MSEKQQRVDSASVSEIEVINSQPNLKPLSPTELIVKQLNKFRFKNQEIMNKLLDTISMLSEQEKKDMENQEINSNKNVNITNEQETDKNQEQNNIIEHEYGTINKTDKTLYLKDIDRTIQFTDTETLTKLQNYLLNMDIFNQILPDFTYSQEFNYKFNQYINQIPRNESQQSNNQESSDQNKNQNSASINIEEQENNNQDNFNKEQEKQSASKTSRSNNRLKQSKQQYAKSLFKNQNEHTIGDFKNTFMSHFYYGYSLNNVDIEKLDSYISMILIEEFILLNKMQSEYQNTAQSKNLTIDLDIQNPPEQLGLLNNIYNAVCVNFQPQSGQSNVGDLYILLMYSDAFDGFDTPQKTGMRRTQDGKSVFFSTQNENQSQQYFNNGHKNREFLSIVPEKYSKQIKNTTQIPQKSIEILVKHIDTDNDLKLTKEDVKSYAYTQYLHWDDEIFENMIKEAASKRRVTNPKQYDSPISIQEILGAVTLHQRLSNEKKWVEYERPYRKYWVQLLQTVGEKVPYSHDLPPLNIQPIKDLHQIQTNTFKPKINKSQSLMTIKDLKKPQYIKPFRAEAGIIINNTQTISEVVLDKEVYDPNKQEAFEKVINQQFKQFDDKGNPTITFNTQSYYKEAERLSRNPIEYVKAEKNPIYQYFPENFNFKKQGAQTTTALNQQQPQNQNQNNQQFSSSQQPFTRFGSQRGSKAYSPNNVPGQQENNMFDQDSSNFIEEEEFNMDMDSLLRTQSILKIGKQLTKTADNKPQSQSQTNLQNVIPVMSRVKLREQKMMAKTQMYLSNKKDNQALQDKGVFQVTFKREDVKSLKARLANEEPVTDPYNPISNFNFREEVYVPDKRQRWQNRIKPDPLDNPYGISIHDPRPKELIERQLRQEQKKQEEEQIEIAKTMGRHVEQKDWVKYFVLPDIQHTMVGNKRPDMFPKGSYEEQANIAHNLLRGESKFTKPFKLFHRQLRTSDKNQSLGEVQDSKF